MQNLYHDLYEHRCKVYITIKISYADVNYIIKLKSIECKFTEYYAKRNAKFTASFTKWNIKFVSMEYYSHYKGREG